jgi:hypothetical protein
MLGDADAYVRASAVAAARCLPRADNLSAKSSGAG